MRTTLNLDDGLVRAAKRRALDTGTTLSALIEASLRETLAQRSAPPPEPVELPVFHGRLQLPPDVDVDDTQELLDHLEGPHRPL